jgi:hypothetical protein
MANKTTRNGSDSTDRDALHHRIRTFFRYLNRQAFDKCWSFLDPALRERGRVEEDKYAKSLSEFLDHFGAVEIVTVKIDLYPGVRSGERTQDSAYPLIVWKDARHVPHLFRERWVKDGKTWYTRVVGLVVPEADESSEQGTERPARGRRKIED